MGLEERTPDQLDQIISDRERVIAQARAEQIAAIREQKAYQTPLADGYRSMVDWLAARADISHQTARSLCWTTTRLEEAPEVEEALISGEITFDRAEQLAQLPADERADHECFDIGQLRKRAAHHRRLTRTREKEIAEGTFLNFQPSLDETTTSMWGELPGADEMLVRKAVDQRADELLGGDTYLCIAHRRALALIAICQDSLYETHSSDGSPPVEVTVTVDATTAVSDGGQTGVAVLTGPRIGPNALEAIACNAIVEVIGLTEEGTPLSLGRRSRTIPPALKRHILTRDLGCVIEGCDSRYRLEAHHVQPWSHGGTTDANNLIALCWFHHHIAVHREGFVITRIGTSRARLSRPSALSRKYGGAFGEASASSGQDAQRRRI